jgi:hypothetical protein
MRALFNCGSNCDVSKVGVLDCRLSLSDCFEDLDIICASVHRKCVRVWNWGWYFVIRLAACPVLLAVLQGADGRARSSAHSLHHLHSVLAVVQSLFFTLIIVSVFVLFLSSYE